MTPFKIICVSLISCGLIVLGAFFYWERVLGPNDTLSLGQWTFSRGQGLLMLERIGECLVLVGIVGLLVAHFATRKERERQKYLVSDLRESTETRVEGLGDILEAARVEKRERLESSVSDLRESTILLSEAGPNNEKIPLMPSTGQTRADVIDHVGEDEDIILASIDVTGKEDAWSSVAPVRKPFRPALKILLSLGGAVLIVGLVICFQKIAPVGPPSAHEHGDFQSSPTTSKIGRNDDYRKRGVGANVQPRQPHDDSETAVKVSKPVEPKLIGDAEWKRYHLWDCKYAKVITDDKSVPLNSASEAFEKGYLPCRACNPPR